MLSDKQPISQDDARKVLERFIVENDELLELEARIGKFNIFDALGIARAEIRHSNFLGFILDPAESHGQGQLFLKAILMDLLKEAEPALRPFSPIYLDGTDLNGVEVRREWKNIDILITCQEPGFVVVIENKVDSHEHSNQLERYSKTIKSVYPNAKTLLVYLTPDGDEASDGTWLPYKYEDIYRVLKKVREAYKNSIGQDFGVFLDHYIYLLGSRFMKDDDLDQLCQRIYKNHRQAIDLIWERVGSPEAVLLDEVRTALREDSRWYELSQARSNIDFIPKSWLDWTSVLKTEDGYPFCVEIWSAEQSLMYALFVGPMKNETLRKEIISKLRDAGPGLGLKPCKTNRVIGRWNRVSGREKFLQWDEEEPSSDECRERTRALLNELNPKLEKLSVVFKPLCDHST